MVSYGWHYDSNERLLRTADDVPALLLALREEAARFAGMEPSQLQYVLVSEYGPGAGIGWHWDKGVFGEVVGVSLLASCVFRLGRKAGANWRAARCPPRRARAAGRVAEDCGGYAARTGKPERRGHLLPAR
jgi:alkylated DNA repair dioxygenase AlkB